MKYSLLGILFLLVPCLVIAQKSKPISFRQKEMLGVWKAGDCQLKITQYTRDSSRLTFICSQEGLKSPLDCCFQPAYQVPVDSVGVAEFYFCGGWQQPIFEYRILELSESEMTMSIKVDYVMAPNLQPDGKRIVEKEIVLNRE